MSDRPFQLYRDLSPAVEAALRASIDRFGVLVPVVKDQDGRIIDGHQRVRIAEELGVKYPVNIIEVADDDEAAEIARTLNEDRRPIAKEDRLPIVKALREDEFSIPAIAGALGVSVGTVHSDLAEVFNAENLPSTVTGLDGKSYPARKTPKPPVEDVLSMAAEENRRRLEERKQRHIEEGRTSVPPPAFDKPTFRVIYADPPWRYNQNALVSADWGMAEDHYPTMSLDDLASIPVRQFALPDSVLFLWATSPMLRDAISLMASWSFTYKTSIVWDKQRPFLGSYVHVSHELLLIGTRGSCTPDAKYTAGSVFRYKQTVHSAKPEEFRHLIDSMYTYGNRVELFCRGEAPDGWHVWGNEVRDG